LAAREKVRATRTKTFKADMRSFMRFPNKSYLKSYLAA
jgi:hypothetical protein